MEETVTNNANLSEVIINTINSLLGSLFSSIDNSVYDTLDSLAFLDTSILNDSFFERTFGQGSNSGLLFIANSLLTAVCIYYCFKLIYSHFTGIQIERPYQFVFKLLIFGIFINCSFFICENSITFRRCNVYKDIYFTSLVSDAIRGIGSNLLGEEICFSNLIENLNSVVTTDANSLNVFSFDGLLKSLMSIGFISLLFTYSLRFIMVKVLLLLTPFALLTLINNSTAWFFKAWLKIFLSLLFIQPFISIILLIVFALDFNSPDVTSKILCVGAMYALMRANTYVTSFVGGISTNVSSNLSFLRGRGKI